MINITNEVMLKTFFGSGYLQTHVTCFKDDPNNIVTANRMRCWAGGYYKDTVMQQNSNQYFTVSLFHPDEKGKARRRKALFIAAYVVALDDVREKLPIEQVNKLPQPTCKMETSPGSEQWFYVLDTPCSNREKFDNLQDGLVAKGLSPTGTDPGQKGVTRYLRLPEGVNTKAKRVAANGGVAPRCKILEWNPEIKVSMEDLAQPFDIDLDVERREGRVDGASKVDDHPLLDLADIIHIKDVRSDGRYDITCPWVEEHTGAVDDGAAIFTNNDGSIGFRCHHGCCEQRTGKDLLNLIEESYTGFTQRLESWKAMRTLREMAGIAAPVMSKPVMSFRSVPTPPVAPVPQVPTDEPVSYQTLIDKLKHYPHMSEQCIQMAYAILKAVDQADHGTRLNWHTQVRDHMQWSKPDLQAIIEQQRKIWYPKTKADVNFFDDCVYVVEQNAFFNPSKRMWLTPDGYQNTYSHINENARSEALVEGRVEKVDRYDYAPGMPAIFVEDGVKCVNGWSEIPDKSAQGPVERWLNHFDALGWGGHKKHILQWMAFTLRFPERKINHILLLGGGEGNGKDFLLYPLTHGFGRDHTTINGEELTREFNDYLLGCKYLHINETELGDHQNARGITNRLKPLATAPPFELRVNIKKVAGIKVRNIVNVSMTSNSVMPLKLSGDARRYYAVWTDVTIRGEDGDMTPEWQAYWTDRWKWMRDCEGWRACLYYLRNNVDLSDFDPGAVPLLTEFIRDIQAASEDPVASLIKELRDRKLSTLSADLVTAADIRVALDAAPMLQCGNSLKKTPSTIVIGKIMKQSAVAMMKRASYGKTDLRIWILRNAARYAEMTGAELGAEYYLQKEK
jgi:hypothetical protein